LLRKKPTEHIKLDRTTWMDQLDTALGDSRVNERGQILLRLRYYRL